MKNLILLPIVCFMLSCNSNDDNSQPKNCTDVFIYGLKVTAKNAVTDAIVTEGLTVTAKDGTYVEQLIQLEDSDFFIGAGEREGAYIIEITPNDYQNFTSNTIVVTKTEDGCHVITEEIEFALQPI